ncbi:MAG: hypothetical protein EXR71_20335 [Myxococcales bacterium]|nr:hypothetical protein [Myxococcales bacterium]
MLDGLVLLAGVALAAEVDGPWKGGAYVDLAVVGVEVHAVWLKKDELWYARGDGAPERVATGVQSGDGGGLRPEVVVSGGAVSVVYSTATALVKRLRAGSGWTETMVSPPGLAGPFLAAIVPAVGGGTLVAGIGGGHHGSSVFVEGKAIYDGGADGVCMCCKPSLVADATGYQLVFRDADGLRRDIRKLSSTDGGRWTDAGEVTHGGWSPGGCPSDGPVATPTTVVVSDGRSGRRIVYEIDRTGEKALASVDPKAEMLQPRALPDASLTTWVEAVPGKSTLVVRDGPGRPQAVASTAGRMEPGDPVAVGSEVWIPWQGDVAHVTRWESQAPPGL